MAIIRWPASRRVGVPREEGGEHNTQQLGRRIFDGADEDRCGHNHQCQTGREAAERVAHHLVWRSHDHGSVEDLRQSEDNERGGECPARAVVGVDGGVAVASALLPLAHTGLVLVVGRARVGGWFWSRDSSLQVRASSLPRLNYKLP